MRVLHIWNTAAAPQSLAKEQIKEGLSVDLLIRKKFDPFNHRSLFPKTIVHKGGKIGFFIKILLMVRKYDIIHIHSLDKVIPLIRRIYPKKKIILTYHGSDIRGRWDVRISFYSKSDFITVATPDLLVGAPKTVRYIPNIVDTEHFSRKNEMIKNTALYINCFNFFPNKELERKEALKFALEKELKLIVWERDSWGPIPYSIFPRFLELFEYYIDFRVNDYGETLDGLSFTALQALALGSKVFFANQIFTEPPKEFDKKTIIEQWKEIYGIQS